MGLRDWLQSFVRRDDHPCACPPDTERVGDAPPEGVECWCERSDGSRHGPHRKWYASGGLEVDQTFRNGRAHGPFFRWYEDGTPEVEPVGDAGFVDGSAHGTWRYYHPNGELQREITVRDGDYVGQRREWYDDGSPKLSEHYDDDSRPVGEHSAWHPNGQLASRGVFVAGKRVGRWERWDVEGALVAHGDYVDGAKQGPWVYAKDGRPWKSGVYDRGMPVGEWTVLDAEGNTPPPYSRCAESSAPSFAEMAAWPSDPTTPAGRLARSWTCTASLDAGSDALAIELFLEPAPIDRDLEPDHDLDVRGAFVARATVCADGVTHVIWHGFDEDITEAPLVEEIPRTATIRIPASTTELELTLETRVSAIGIDGDRASVDVRAHSSLRAPFPQRATVALEETRLEGRPFDGPASNDAEPAQPSPPIDHPIEAASTLAVIAGLGRVARFGLGDRLHRYAPDPVSRRLESAHPDLLWREATTPGPHGLLARVRSGWQSKSASPNDTCLVVERWPGRELVCELGPEHDVDKNALGAFDADGRLFLFATRRGRGMALLDLERGEVRWERPIDGYFSTHGKHVTDEVHIATDRFWIRYDLDSGDEVARQLLTRTGWGELPLTSNANAGRVAWMYPVSLMGEPTSLVGWCDRDGSTGSVLVPDAAFGSAFQGAVLDDGRIVVVICAAWLVDPAHGVRFLAPPEAVAQPRLFGASQPMVIDRDRDGRHRLWCADPTKPLFISFD